MKYIITSVLSFLVLSTFAQSPIPTENIAVKDTVPYTEKITIGEGDAASEVTLTLLFSEEYNTLTATLSSDNPFLSFAEPVRYKETKKKQLFRTYLSPKKMPYTVNYEYKSKFRYTKEYLKKLRQPRDGNVYQPLFSVYGMSPIGREQQYMVNNSVFQIFQIDSTRNDVFIDLGDVISVVKAKRARPGRMRYKLTALSNINKKYKVTLSRDLCAGFKDSISAVEQKTKALDGYLQLLQEMSDNFNISPSKGGVAMFNTIKNVVTAKYEDYPKRHDCPALSNSFAQYNAIMDKINSMECVINIPDEIDDDVDPRNPRLDVSTLLNIIRNLDRIKLKMISAKDEAEKEDLKSMAEGLILDGEDLIEESTIISNREINARDNFYKAVDSYKKYSK